MTELDAEQQRHRIRLGLQFSAVVVGFAMLVAIALLAVAFHSLSRNLDVQGCRASYSAQLNDARDARPKAILAGLHDLSINDKDALATDTASTPSIEKAVTQKARTYNAALALSNRDPGKFLEQCHRPGGPL